MTSTKNCIEGMYYWIMLNCTDPSYEIVEKSGGRTGMQPAKYIKHGSFEIVGWEMSFTASFVGPEILIPDGVNIHYGEKGNVKTVK